MPDRFPVSPGQIIADRYRIQNQIGSGRMSSIRFCVSGSFNWLSYRGAKDRGYRRETSFYSERPADIALWQNNAASLFR